MGGWNRPANAVWLRLGPGGGAVTNGCFLGCGMGLVARRLTATLMLCLPLAVGGGRAMGEGLNLSGSSKSRTDVFASQAKLLDGRLAKQYSGSERLTPNAKKKKVPGTTEDAAAVVYRGSYKGEYLDIAKAAAAKHNVPEDLFLRLVQKESGWNAAAVSPKGAIGLAQIMPSTADHLGVDISDPAQNLDGGARYLRQMYDRFGSWRLALAAYNAGPGAVEEHDGVPPYDETVAYVSAILG
jgi:Transglycosylase SLT domain